MKVGESQSETQRPKFGPIDGVGGIEKLYTKYKFYPIYKNQFTSKTRLRIAVISAFVALATIPWYPEGNILAFVGVASTTFALIVGFRINAIFPALPMFAVAVFGVQNVICPIFFYSFPELVSSSFPLTSSFLKTFNLSCLASVILLLGVWIPIVSILPKTRVITTPLEHNTRKKLIQWSWIIWGAGTLLSLITSSILGADFGYVWALLLLLKIVAIFTLVMLLPKIQAKIFLVLLLVTQTVSGFYSTFLGEITINCGLAFIFFGYRYRWRKRLAIIMFLFMILTGLSQDPKLEYRSEIWVKRDGMGKVEALGIFRQRFSELLNEPGKILEFKEYWSMISRLNQGKITEQVVETVPSREPYAYGETFLMAVKLIIPRFLWSGKPTEYSKIIFSRYSGHPLFGPSMGLGQLGECYINFGGWFGLVVFGLYSLSIGLISRFWVLRGCSNPLWWPWYMYIMFYWVKFEIDFPKAINWLIKAPMMFLFIIYVFPYWRSALGFGMRDKRHAK
jgi:hypothetical protein